MNNESILAFRKAFRELPDELKEREAMRALMIAKKEPFIIFEDEDTGKVLKFMTRKDLADYLWTTKSIKVTSNHIGKVLRGERNFLCNYKIYYQYEED